MKTSKTQKQGFRDLGLCLCAAVCLILLSCKTPWARTLVIEGLEETPLKWVGHEEPMGIDIDIMTEVLSTMGIRDYVFRFVDTGSRLLHNARNGTSDITLTLSMNTERAEFLLYPNEAHLLLDWRFAIRAEDQEKIRFEEFSDLARVRIGAAAEYSYTSTFWNSGLDIQTAIATRLPFSIRPCAVLPIIMCSRWRRTIRTRKSSLPSMTRSSARCAKTAVCLRYLNVTLGRMVTTGGSRNIPNERQEKPWLT